MQLIDSHLHLQDPALAPDLETVLARAQERSVNAFVCNGTQESDWADVAAIARRFKSVIPCFGLHPWFVKDRSPEWSRELEKRLSAHPYAPVGEIGLDGKFFPEHEAAQIEVFATQLEIAARLKRPVEIHCYKAWDQLCAYLDVLRRLPYGFMLHAFSGPAGLIAKLADAGAYFSFSGTVLYDLNKKGRRRLAATPSNRLLFETDAPDMPPPEAYRITAGSEHNEPANLALIVAGAAGLLKTDANELGERIWNNARKFFGPSLEAIL